MLFQTGCLVLLAGLLLVAAWRDLRTLRIGNELSLGIAALFGVWAVAGWLAGELSPLFLGTSVACAAGLFGVGAVAFANGMIGGGDVKFLAAVGLFAGPAHVIDLLLVTALVGGVIAAFAFEAAALFDAAASPSCAGAGVVPRSGIGLSRTWARTTGPWRSGAA